MDHSAYKERSPSYRRDDTSLGILNMDSLKGRGKCNNLPCMKMLSHKTNLNNLSFSQFLVI